MHRRIDYCSRCRTLRNLTGYERRRKQPGKKRPLRTRFYRCETCHQFVFSEHLDRLPKRKKTAFREQHYGFGAHRT